MDHDDRQTLRDAALAAVNGTRARSNVRRAALAADWKLQTSNSFRRIGGHGDGDVLCGTKHPIDGQPDLLAAPGVLDYIIAAQPHVVIQLLDAVDALEDKLGKAKIICDTIADVERRLGDMASGLTSLGDAFIQLVATSDEREWTVAIEKVRSLLAQLGTHLKEVPR